MDKGKYTKSADEIQEESVCGGLGIVGLSGRIGTVG